MTYSALSRWLSQYPPFERAYLRWTLNKLHRDEFMAFTEYQILIIGTLHSVPFIFVHRLDDARVKDAFEMRIDYFDNVMASEVRGNTPIGDVIPTAPSCYEVILALAEKVYDEVISDHHNINDIFWTMVQNLLDVNIHTGLPELNPDEIRWKIQAWVERKNGATAPCPISDWICEPLWYAAQKYFSDWS